MQATAEHLEFAPPPTRGGLRALLLAVTAHVLLMAALTWGISWKRDSVTVVASAELWSAVPQEAAPAPVPEPPAPPTPPLPEPPRPQVAPEPPAKPPELDADIALEREKKRKRLERIEEIRKEQEDRRKQAAADKEKKKQAELDKEKQRLEQLEREKKLALDKRDKQAKARAEAEAQREQLDAKRIEASRQEQLKRMMAGVAGAAGTSEATGTAKQSSGPSATYAGKIVERIRNNTSFTDASAGKPTVIVDVRVNASGAIVSRRVTQPSGNRAYDDAVLKAIDKMEFLPKDADGRIPALVLTEGLELKVTL